MFELIFPSISAIVSITFIGIMFGLILSVAKLKLKVDKDPRIERLIEELPGANCGACGQPGCAGYAQKIVEENMDINLCPVGGEELIKGIASIMGVEAADSRLSEIARVHCQGGITETVKRFIYNGPRDCKAANDVMDGFKVCEYGCLGFGDCVRSCPFDAIYVTDNGLPVVDLVKCTGCGNCVDVCPRNIISLIPEKFDVYVMCMNREKGAAMKKGCSVGCIGCKMCENKACEDGAIEVHDFCAEIDYDKCTNCYKCVEICPVPVIDPLSKAKKKKKPPVKEKAPEKKLEPEVKE